MRKWCVRIFLSVIFLSLTFANFIRHEITELKKCEGEIVNFSNPFELKEYILVKWTFSTLSTPTDIAKSKNIEEEQIEYLAEGYEHRLKVFPGSTIKFSLRQITRKDNGTYTFIIFHGDGDQDIFKWNLQVEAVTNITKPSVITNIVSGTECTEYICSTEQKDVHRSWIYQGDKQINGSTLWLCNNNRSQAVSCIVKDACSSNYTTVIEDRKYCSLSSVKSDDLAWENYLAIGIVAGIAIAMCIVVALCCFLPLKTKVKIFNLRRPSRHPEKEKEVAMISLTPRRLTPKYKTETYNNSKFKHTSHHYIQTSS